MMFAAKIISPGAVQSLEDGTFKVVSEKKEKQVVEIVMCARCRHPVTEDDLVSGVTCKECGKVVNPNDIDANGVCDVCKAKKERADLANASTEDLIKMIINMEKAAKGVAPVMVTEAEPVAVPDITDAEPVVEEPASIDASEEAPDTASEGDDKKSTRKRRARRSATEDAPAADEDTDKEPSADNSADAAPEESATDAKVEVDANVNDLANQQEAPFPDAIAEDITGVNMNVAAPVAPMGDVGGINNFAMFESSDESF
jgi:predicted Zn-ribbon and HTH transcriptional regulator